LEKENLRIFDFDNSNYHENSSEDFNYSLSTGEENQDFDIINVENLENDNDTFPSTSTNEANSCSEFEFLDNSGNLISEENLLRPNEELFDNYNSNTLINQFVPPEILEWVVPPPRESFTDTRIVNDSSKLEDEEWDMLEMD